MRGRVRAAACVLAAVNLSTFATAAPPNDAKLNAYGKRLSFQCTSCHRIDDTGNGVPSIVGWPAEDFIWVLKAYKEGGRTNPEMVSATRPLDDDQIRALANYFGSLKSSGRRLR